jgi:hypothetical protein
MEYFTTLSGTQAIEHMITRELLGKDLEENARGLSEIKSINSPASEKENQV